MSTMPISLYNSLSKKVEPFFPLKNKQVSMYVCGITPYDTTHIGHAFTNLTFDILRRYLTFQGYTVTYTQNVTDVDDEVLKKARAAKKFINDLSDLNILMPTYYVKTTDSIETMLEMTEKLVNKGFAYEKDGNVYFRVSKDPGYGKLSRLSREEMTKLSKERGEDPLDFILWQKAKEGEPSWESPWGADEQSDGARLRAERDRGGYGRPGWHIECSAMIYDYLGEQIDIHGGGEDLIYPHHENEIAQSEHFTGKKPLAKFFMHTGAVSNLVMVSDLLKNYSPNAIRYLLLSHHYRKPWEFHAEELDKAQTKIKQIENAINHKLAKKYGERSGSMDFIRALDDDLNTPEALKIIDHFAKQTIKSSSFENQKTLREMCAILGFTF